MTAQQCLTGEMKRVDPYLKMSKIWPVGLVCCAIIDRCYTDNAEILPLWAFAFDNFRFSLQIRTPLRVGAAYADLFNDGVAPTLESIDRTVYVDRALPYALNYCSTLNSVR